MTTDWLFNTEQTAKPVPPSDTAINFARCFATDEGARVLDYLVHITRRVMGPNATENALYYAEGQRAIVVLIESLITQGRG